MGDTVQIKLGVSGLNAVLAAFRQLSGGALSLTGAFATLVAVTKQSINLADEMGKAAQRAGESVKQFSALSYSAKLAGTDLQTLTGIFKDLNNAIVDNNAGLKELQIDRFAAGGGYKRTIDVLLEISDAFQKMEDGSKKTTIATQIFKKNWADAIPFLNQGADSIRKTAKEAADFGLVIDKDFAAASDQFNTDIERLRASAQGFGFDLARGMIKPLADLADAMLKVSKAAHGLNFGVSLGGAIGSALPGAFSPGSFLASIIAGTAGRMAGSKKKPGTTEDVLAGGKGPTGPELISIEDTLREFLAQSAVAGRGGTYGLAPRAARESSLENLRARLVTIGKLKDEIDKTAKPDTSLVMEGHAARYTVAAKEYNDKMRPVLADELKIRQEIFELQKEADEETRPQLSQFATDLTQTISDLSAAMGTFTQNLAGLVVSPFAGLFDGMNESIKGLLKGTLDWKEALTTIETSVISGIIDAFAKMAASFVTNLILTAAVGKTLQAASLAAIGPIATAATALWTTPAFLASVATGGAAVATGASALAIGQGTALASNTALGALGGAYEQGGYTGSQGGIVHPEEYVIPKQRVQEYGLPFFDAIRSGRFGGGGGGSSTFNFAMMGNQSDLDDYKNRHFVDAVIRVGQSYKHKFAA